MTAGLLSYCDFKAEDMSVSSYYFLLPFERYIRTKTQRVTDYKEGQVAKL